MAQGLWCRAALAALSVWAGADWAVAECNCRGGGVRMVSQPGLPPAPSPSPSQSAPLDPYAQPPGYPSAPSYALPSGPVTTSPLPQGGLPSPLQPPGPATGAMLSPLPDPELTAPPQNRFGVAPPPGTLGRTWQRRSMLIGDDQHPRMAAIEVRLPENVDVSARGLKSKWTGEVWRLETETPLLPGVPHVYAVKAERDAGNGEKSTDVRWVRMIPGRVVDLDF